jgi:hypothetical protein
MIDEKLQFQFLIDVHKQHNNYRAIIVTWLMKNFQFKSRSKRISRHSRSAWIKEKSLQKTEIGSGVDYINLHLGYKNGNKP